MAMMRQRLPVSTGRGSSAFIRAARAERLRMAQDRQMRRLQVVLAMAALLLAVNAVVVMLLN